jgi:hypothetical protein
MALTPEFFERATIIPTKLDRSRSADSADPW